MGNEVYLPLDAFDLSLEAVLNMLDRDLTSDVFPLSTCPKTPTLMFKMEIFLTFFFTFLFLVFLPFLSEEDILREYVCTT